MEGKPEESDEDVPVEEKPTVLWEKCIQQSIFVDLSEDESLHFSDLEGSLGLHLSQAESAASEASIHLSGSSELSALDDTSSDCSSQSERVEENKAKSSVLHLSAQRHNTMQNMVPQNQRYEDPGQSTSDEEQDDLPYDGDLGSRYFNCTGSSPGSETDHASPENVVSVKPFAEKAATSFQGNSNSKGDDLSDGSKPNEEAPSHTGPVDGDQQRHLSKEELLRSGRLIEAETLPEVSLLESVDDTVFSWAPTHYSAVVQSENSQSCARNSEINQSLDGGRIEDESENTSKNSNSGEETEKETDGVASDAADEQGGTDRGALDKDEDDPVQRVPLVRTRSFSEMKYGQGQVHYPLPDFSKVASKVKIPRAPSSPARPGPQVPSTMHRAQSSPGMLEVISMVLEDSIQPSEKPYVFKDVEKQTAPTMVHRLQAEYDKLLTKYAEAENLIDQMRIGTNTQASSELMLFLERDDDELGNLGEGGHLGSLAPYIPPSETCDEKVEKELNTSNEPEPEPPSDGELMTAELRDIISQFMQKVEEFKMSISNMSVSKAEQQMMLRSMMEAQDQLERKYISKKDEHRALEMQNYMGLSRNTGTFDPNRLVEGDIFRIGMHLEDIKEMIDRNMCEQISPPHSSSTPRPITESLHVKPGPVCMHTDSPPLSQHEEPCAGFSTATYKTETRTEEKNDEEAQDSWSSRCSLEGLHLPTAEDEEDTEEERTQQGVVNANILACLSGTSLYSRQRQWPADSSSQDGVLNPEGEYDLVDGVSLAVEVSSSSDAAADRHTCSLSEPPLNTSSVSQRIVSPETDSGFGSSYLSQSASGTFQPHLLTESVQSQNDDLSSSGSEGSSSNLQTAIHSVSQRLDGPHLSLYTQSCGAVELWVENTTKEPPVRLQAGSDPGLPAPLHHHVSEPALSIAMDTAQRGSHMYSCSSNSEAILALQSEVSRLKKDLNEGLVQLPHLAQKMDYLTSRYRQDRQERRSKTRPRTHRPAQNSMWKATSSRQNMSNLSSSQVKIDDWISSDMDPSKSKGTDSIDATGSEISLQFHNSPAGSRRGSSTAVCSVPEFLYKNQGTLPPSRGSEGSRSVKTSGLTSSCLKEERDIDIKMRTQTSVMESLYSKERWSLLSAPSLQRPLLQVSYGSSSSLPASYKVKEPPLQPHPWKRFTQSDSALLPSNVYFQRTQVPVPALSKTGSGRTGRRRGNKEEEMNRTLDRAIEMARSMKRTTDHMAKSLSADLAQAQRLRKLHNIQQLGGRKHHVL